ncbi:MAG: integrase, partial [Deltaproteobacteria bacterium]|nr:integrase [Deltaproteobacteria bacterium]
FILLFVTIDFLPALVTTSLYFIITVCVTVGRDLWIENKQQY